MDVDVLRRWLDQRTEQYEFSGVALVWRDGAPLFRTPVGWRTAAMVWP
jgi:hypothetical protein